MFNTTSHSRLIVLVITSVSTFLTAFLGSSIQIALPTINSEFTLDAVFLGWIASIYTLTAAIAAVIFGKLADSYGSKKIFLLGIAVYSLVSLLSSMASSGIFLFICRGLHGIGMAMIHATSVAILALTFPANKRGIALGINVSTIYAGLSIGPVLGGFLIQQYGWRSIFLVNVFAGFIILVLSLCYLKREFSKAHKESFDITGAIIYGIALASTIYGLTMIPSSVGILCVILGILGLVFFFKWELKAKNPVLNVHLFANTTFLLSSFAALFNYSATAGVTVLMSFYLQYIQNLNPYSTGLIMISQPVLQVIVSPLAGKLSDKIEPRVVASIGMALTTICLILFIFMQKDTDLLVVVTSLMLLGIGFALFVSPNTNAIMSSVENNYYGVASATVATMRMIGQIFSLGLVTLLFNIFIGQSQINTESATAFMASFSTAFIVFSILSATGTVTSFIRGNIRKRIK